MAKILTIIHRLHFEIYICGIENVGILPIQKQRASKLPQTHHIS